jgi:hypothetical protein
MLTPALFRKREKLEVDGGMGTSGTICVTVAQGFPSIKNKERIFHGFLVRGRGLYTCLPQSGLGAMT